MNAKRKPQPIERFARPEPRQADPDPPRDQHGKWQSSVKRLALEFGRPWQPLYDEWVERAQCRSYCGQDESSADAAALCDLRDRLEATHAVRESLVE